MSVAQRATVLCATCQERFR
ncbi:MAG: hypothetical protein ACYS0G_13580 [Planctomycetota bacterium]